MKKFPALAASLLLSLTLTACGGGGSSGDTATSSTASSTRSSAAASSGSSLAASSAATSSSSLGDSSSSATSSTASSSATTGGVTIHMLGDSTMTIYTEDRRPQMGWGEKLPMFFNSSVTVKNWALGGRSSRSFYNEATRWPAILPVINAGDYVIIQFAHNDQKYGSDYAVYGTYAFCSDGSGDGEACTGAVDALDSSAQKNEHSYYQYLKQYVSEIKAKGAYPILMSPIVRKYFSGSSITAEGQHNVAIKGTETYVRGDYPAAMKAVATKYGVPFVDLTAETKSIVESYGDTAATANLYIAADSTHPQVLFATLIAKKAVEGMKSLNILKPYMVDVSSLVASPSSLAWSTRYVNVASTKSITLSAFDLAPAAGTVTATSPSSAFELSLDQTTWSNAVTVNYTNAAFTKTLYVRFTPTAVQDYSGNISFSQAGSSLGTVAVSGSGVAAGAGVDSYATWFTAGTSVTAVTDGLVTASDVLASDLTATTSKVIAVDGQDTTVARYSVNTWASRDEGKYLEFAVTPSGAFSVSAISAYLTTSGGSTVVADMDYSTDKVSWTKLNSTTLAFSKDTMTKLEYSTTIQVAATGTLYLRIYPWNTSGSATTTGKSLGLYGVKIFGKVSQ
ncbi:rhamnogalacturonan acetylesterase [Uliginosibacterium sp. 31-12]|uniref:rhamnogalacturonan acetylesterase n=1 Tax=Uliginosibacterium sp. 31-12 TaxID=3062781 RepID=UPI0026E1834C|nr:rhamnogalacturonan acetylesterase [Uliginosibacterium sp. 31-12]MDO6387246.1 rhamnogalacturonan acetylesterase [Uliginosibacterium sp. 31-12]